MSRAIQLLFCAVGTLGLGLLAVTVAARIFYPWPLEWMEGATLHHALRLVQGRALYARPSAEFIPFVYPPLAYLPMALSVACFGVSLAAARLVSVVSLLGSLVLLGRAAARMTKVPSAGLLAAGLYALGFGYTGGFMDLARVDAFFMALVIAGVERMTAERPRAALVCFALACFAKQHGALFLLAATVVLLARDARKHAGPVAAVWLASVAAVAWLEQSTAGWFSSYVFSVPRSHGIVAALLGSYFFVDLGVYLPVLSTLAVLGCLRHRRAPRALDVLLLAALIASALGRAHPGGDDNIRLPGYALVVLAAVIWLCEILVASPSRWRRGVWCAALVVQVAMLVQWPSAHAPDAASARGFVTLTQTLERCAKSGKSVALDYALLAGTPFFHTMALSDLRTGSDQRLAQQATRAIIQTLSSSAAAASLAASASFPELQQVLAAHYDVCASMPRFPITTGYQPGATIVYTRRATSR
jgi:4-amino-4-deoxy-L-arabinose transferase-like glycosyltransferase